MPQVDLVMIFPQVFWVIILIILISFKYYAHDLRLIHFMWQSRIKQKLGFWTIASNFLKLKKMELTIVSSYLNQCNKNSLKFSNSINYLFLVWIFLFCQIWCLGSLLFDLSKGKIQTQIL